MPQVYFFYQRKRVTCQEGQTIQEVARAHDISISNGTANGFNCHGLGLCKSCRVRVIKTDHLSPPSWLERLKILPNPWRQACKARILGDITVWTQGDFPTRLPPGPEETRAGHPAGDGMDRPDILIEEITPERVKELMDHGDPVLLLDVRERSEYERARIEGAVLIPLGELSSRLHELDPEADIIVHCHHGMRSHAAAELLLTSGFKRVRNMRGGIDGWSLKVDFSVPRY
jgi:rhodanese-related sulfurtransferase/ferredoxin